ncbi:hypothetical protein OIE75_29950 [Streptomyces sp. NBC_01723]|uniref:hypothetical protein n=1 Tax=Streptomyces sp. NBC_01723 TaxID=2975921 RepID=UPI002E341918|nr:hypothetical protein [Streptomyces sp. NBC_01723]
MNDSCDVRPVLDRMLAAAREGLGRSTWRIGDPDERLLLPIVGALTVHLGKELGIVEEGWDAAQTRRVVATELRTAARRHPAGTARHQAFLEAAQMAEDGNA